MISQLMRFASILLIPSVLLSCVVKTTNRTVGSRPLNIQDIRVAEGSDKTIVEVEGEGLMLFTTFRLTSPDRLVLEISEVGLGKYHDEINLSEGPIHSIVPVPSGDIHVSRIEFRLSGKVSTNVRPEGLNIVVEVTQLEGGAESRLAGSQEKSTGNTFKFFEEETAPKKKAPETSDMAAKPSTGTSEMSMTELPGETKLVETLSPPLVPPVSATLPKPSVKKAVKPKTKPVPKPTPKAVAKPSKQLAAATKVMTLQFVEGGDLKLLISLDGKSKAKVFYSNRTKKHLVVDFPGVKKNMAGRRIQGDGRIVQRVRTGVHADKLRLVLDLLLPVNYSLVQNEDKVEIILKENTGMKTFPK